MKRHEKSLIGSRFGVQVDVVVTFMSDMVGDCEETIMDNIIMLGEHGITVETANDDMAGYYQKMEQAGKKQTLSCFCL